MDMKYLKEKGYFLDVISVVTALILLGFYFLKPSFNEVRYTKKAEIVQENLIELRVALEKYYEVAGKYPDLSKDGVVNNLKLLDYTDKNGKLISFAEIYGRNILKSTESTDNILSSNKIIDTSNFLEGDKSGGWLYDFSNQTGEIHPNLPTNAYFQNIVWIER